MHDKYENYQNLVEYELDQRDSMPSWSTPFREVVVRSIEESFQAGRTIVQAADCAELEAWLLSQHQDMAAEAEERCSRP